MSGTTEKVLKALGLEGVPLLANHCDDDGVDRLNHRWTVVMLIIFALVLTAKQFVGEPIYCWTPAHFMKDSHDDYTNSYCWVRSTYYLPDTEYIPTEEEVKRTDGKHTHITYYQWVPAILLIEALMFYVPYFIWNELNTRSGIDLHSVVQAGKTFEATEMNEIRDKTLQFMTMQLDRYLRCHNYTGASSSQETKFTMSVKRCLTRTCCKPFGRRRGNYLVCLYVVVKLLYVINAVGQVFLLDYFITGSALNAYGIDVIRGAVDLTSDWPAASSTRFPRATMCDIKIRRLGNIHRYTVQCVLPINAFNEKIFLFLWFWFVFVAVVTCCSLIMWLVRFFVQSYRRRYVRQHLDFLEKLKTDGDRKNKLRRFVHKYLNQDGVFILRLLAHNASTITATELIASVWENYRKKPMADGIDEADV